MPGFPTRSLLEAVFQLIIANQFAKNQSNADEDAGTAAALEHMMDPPLPGGACKM
jgi:hypothetical protein